MRPVKNLFSGSLGKLQNIGGSKFFTTPHTVLVPVDYEINSGSQGEFIAYSLDGRLWLFSDRLTALKWNINTSRMEFAKSLQVDNKNFIARGIDWILTSSSFFQVLDDAPYIFSEAVNFNEALNVEAFYSFLPAIDGWQIIKNFLVRRYGNDDEAPLHSLSIPAGLYLTNLDNAIYGKDNSYIGSISIEDYQLVISPDYSISANVSGLAFLDKTLYGFRLKQDSSLCPVSEDTLLFNAQAGSWSNVFDGQDTSGNIFFDPFNCKAVAVRDDTVNLLPEKKIFTAKGISQWFAPTRNIASVTSDFVIAQLEHDILATHVNSGLYREILHQKNLALTCRGYSDYKLAIGEINNVLRFNKIIHNKTYHIRLLNAFEHDIFENGYFLESVSEARYNYKNYVQIPVYYEAETLYSGKDYEGNFTREDFVTTFTDSEALYFQDVLSDGSAHHMTCKTATAKIFHINPVTGIPEIRTFTINFQSDVVRYEYDNNPGVGYYYIRYAEYPQKIIMLDDNLVWEVLMCTFVEDPNNRYHYDYSYKYIPLISRQELLSLNFQSFSWSINEDGFYDKVNEVFNSSLQLININISSAEATFKDNNTNTLITFNIPREALSKINNKYDESLGNIDLTVHDFININNPNEILHIATYHYQVGKGIRHRYHWGDRISNTYSCSFLVFKSEL